MNAEHFAALKNAIEQGGTDLTAKAVGGPKGAADEMVAAGFLAKKGTKYSVTAAGREALTAEDTEAKHAERAESAKLRTMVAFLRAVEAKPGKPVAKEAAAAGQDTIDEAKRERLVIPGKKANVFELQPKGHATLLKAELLEVQPTACTATWRRSTPGGRGPWPS